MRRTPPVTRVREGGVAASERSGDVDGFTEERPGTQEMGSLKNPHFDKINGLSEPRVTSRSYPRRTGRPRGTGRTRGRRTNTTSRLQPMETPQFVAGAREQIAQERNTLLVRMLIQQQQEMLDRQQ